MGADGWATARLSCCKVDTDVRPVGEGAAWRCCVAEATACSDGVARRPGALTLDALTFAFRVSLDEEHVELRVASGGRSYELGARNYHYLLLILARKRREDASRLLNDSSCGWIDVDSFAHDPAMAPSRINTAVFRIRARLRALGVVDASAVIERRRERQIRIGTSRLSVETI
jgi:hypothetical protein